MRKTLIACVVLLCAFVAKAVNFSEKTDIDDMTLVYLGAGFHPAWDEETFESYVSHTYPDGTQSWLFDGFLFLDYCINNDKGQIVSLGEYNGPGAQKSDWEKLLKVQVGEDSGNGLRALDNVIGRLKRTLGEPGHKHQVVMGVPVAEIRSGKNWGELGDGRQLDFATVADRVRAMKWYVDQLLDVWKAQKFKNIELAGVYWVKETFYDVDDAEMKDVVKLVNAYYHEKDLTVYWVPSYHYYNHAGNKTIDSLGMDVIYIQPNYYFNTDIPISQLDSAIGKAWEDDRFVEVEFNEKALFSVSQEYRARMLDYINHFEEQYVFDYMPVAYYSNDLGVKEFKQSTNKFDQAFINRLAGIINKRHVETGWDAAPRAAGMDDVMVEPDYEIAYAVDGGIFIDNRVDCEVEIYAIDGRVVMQASPRYGDFGYVVPCPKGLYVVKAGKRSVKIAVCR